MHPVRPGSIEVITGPMFSGKSEELIRRLRRARIARLEIRVFKHNTDDRYSTDHLASHSDWRFPSQAVASAADVIASVGDGVQVVGLDEAHFLEDALVNGVRTMADRGMRVIIAGLDLDFTGEPFGPMPQLLAIADEVTKTHAICAQCGEPAHFSQRLVSSRERVLVGAHEAYEPRCRRCFIPTAPEGVTAASGNAARLRPFGGCRQSVNEESG